MERILKSEMNCLIVLPVYNEADYISSLVKSILSYQNHIDILVVNDGSTDETELVIDKLPVKVIHHDQNKGKGAAIRTAIQYGKQYGYDWIITMDGDGQHPPEYLNDFLEEIALDRADLVLGNRQSREQGMPFHRRLSNGTTSVMVSLCAGNNRIHDSQCGYRALRLNKFHDSNYTQTGFQFESEMILRMGKSRCRIKEIPVSTHYGNESSSIHLVYDTLRFIKLIINSFLW